MENQPKFCPKCGNQLNADAKFCPKCGFAISELQATSSTATADSATTAQPETATSQAAPASAAPNETLERAHNFTSNYFKWLWETLRHPGAPLTGVNRSFGATSFILESLLVALSLFTIMKKIETAIRYRGGVDAEKLLSVLQADGLIFKLLIEVFVVVLIIFAMYTGVAYLFRRMVTSESPNYWNFVNRFASVTNLIVVLDAIVFLWCLIPSGSSMSGFGDMSSSFNSFFTPFIPMALVNLIITIAYIYVIVADVEKPRFNKFYAVLLAEIALVIVAVVLTVILMFTIGLSMVNYFQGLQNVL